MNDGPARALPGHDFERRAATYEQMSSWVSHADVVGSALDLLSTRSALGHVLDVGGGTGALSRVVLERLAPTSIMVLDPSPSMLTHVSPPIGTVMASLGNFNPEGKLFDTLLMRQVLHYLDRPEEDIARAAKLVAPGGALYVGQIVAPSIASAQWLDGIARSMSDARRRVWTCDRLLGMLNTQFALRRASLHPFTDSLTSWVERRVADLDPHTLIDIAERSASPAVRAELGLRPGGPGKPFTVLWFHGLFTARSKTDSWRGSA